jgi:hypothetical protein
MPSPFPGMDPFLEHPEVFPCLHHSLVFCLQEALQPRLPNPYFAKTSERVWIEAAERYVEPDVEVMRRDQRRSGPEDSSGGVALATSARSKLVVVTVPEVPDDEYTETFVDVYTWEGSDKRLVTSIEVLSLSNKTSGRKGRDLYLRKQEEILNSNVHLVEIDLLRGGVHTTAVPKHQALKQAGPFDYHVSIRCFDEPTKFCVFPISLHEPLPGIAIPLLPGDAPVPIDLQAVFQRAYDAGPYHREVNYSEDSIIPPLSPEQTKWANEVLQVSRKRTVADTSASEP